MTKLRLSCHCLPVEVLRYNGTDRQYRTCNICTLNQVGNENHYLNECTNKKLVDIREKFMVEVKKLCTQLSNFSTENIMTYCMSMKDEVIQEITSNFIFDLIRQFKIEDKLPPLHILCLRYIGRIRKPQCRTNFTKHK